MSPNASSPISAMAAPRKTGSSGPLLIPTVFWKCFHAEAESRVQECNALAGERLWRVKLRKQLPYRLAIESTTCPEDYVECTLDPATETLSCRPGPALTATCCEFQLDCTGKALRMGNIAYTTGEAVALILDELVFVHGDR